MSTIPPAFDMGEMPPTAKWPKNLGIIAIVLGACGSLAGMCAVGSIALSSKFLSMAAGQQSGRGGPSTEHMMAVIEKFKGPMIAQAIVASLVALILLYAGILLIKRRPNAVSVVKLWAVIKTLISIFGTVVGYYYGLELSKTEGSSTIFHMVTTVLGFVWAMALPIFMFIWFARSSVREEVASWTAAE